MSRSRSLRVAAATGIAGLLAAGCASSQPAGAAKAASVMTPHQAILLAASQTRRVDSLSTSLTVTISGSIGMTMRGTMSIQIHPTLRAELSVPSVVADGQSLPGGLTEIIGAKAFYLKMSVLSKEVGKPWLEVPYSELQTATGLDVSSLLQQIQTDSPLQETQELAGADDVRDLGSTTIDGVAATEYSGTFSTEAGLAQLPASERATSRQGFEQAGITSVDFNVWLDGQQLVRKIIMTGRGTKDTVIVSEQVTSINQPVNLQFPPASQVATIPASELGSGQ